MALNLYTPVRIGRSDGQEQIRTPQHGLESNGPSPSQLDRVGNPTDYYELLDPDHATLIEWKRILGALLQRTLRISSEKDWFLVAFPENYRLYRHVRFSNDNSNRSADPTAAPQKSSMKSDFYLYGYPLGNKKRFRTAIDFFPHLLWLAEDKSEDYADCSCKHCSPDWIQKIFPQSTKEDQTSAAPSQATSITKEVNPGKKETNNVKKEPALTSDMTPKVVIKQRPESQDRPAKPPSKTPTPVSSTANAPVRAPKSSNQPPNQPLTIAQPRSSEQADDAEYGRYIYRPGEVTWFSKGPAWGLGIVLERTTFSDGRNNTRPAYLLQPLSHPLYHPSIVRISSEHEMRPWLAWSAPDATFVPLQKNPQWNYDNIPWQDAVKGALGVGEAEVDGSIFAAKMVDGSFTLIEPLTNNTTTTGERSYNAIFFGGEKIWVGEPIRLRSHQDIMVVNQIIEKLKPGSTDTALATVQFFGDVYRSVTIQSPRPGASDGIPSMAHLPLRMQKDLFHRNLITGQRKSLVSYWNLITPQHRASLKDVKGRWYESTILLPILRGTDAFQKEANQGDISDVGLSLNAREDGNRTGTGIGKRVKNRLEAFGAATPPGTKIGQGWENTVKVKDAPPATGTQVNAPLEAVSTINAGSELEISGANSLGGTGDEAFAEYMNLDRT